MKFAKVYTNNYESFEKNARDDDTESDRSSSTRVAYRDKNFLSLVVFFSIHETSFERAHRKSFV